MINYSLVYPTIVTLLISPLIGFGVDKYGNHQIWAFISNFVWIIASILLVYYDDNLSSALLVSVCFGVSQSITMIVSNGSLISVMIKEE